MTYANAIDDAIKYGRLSGTITKKNAGENRFFNTVVTTAHRMDALSETVRFTEFEKTIGEPYIVNPETNKSIRKHLFIALCSFVIAILSVWVYPPFAFVMLFVISTFLFKAANDLNNFVKFINKRYLDAGLIASFGFIIETIVVILQ